METALTMANGRLLASPFFDPHTRIQLPISSKSPAFSVRFSLCDPDTWEGNVKLSTEQNSLTRSKRDATSSHSNERPLRREEDTSRTTGKSRGEIYLEQALEIKDPRQTRTKSFRQEKPHDEDARARNVQGASTGIKSSVRNLDEREVEARASTAPNPNDFRVESYRPIPRTTDVKLSPSNPGREKSSGDSEGRESERVSKVTGKSRGEIFLERALEARVQVSGEASSAAFKARKERARNREKLAVAVAKRSEPCCYGCGAVLQFSESEAPGFLPLDTFELVGLLEKSYAAVSRKKKHHQLKTVLCGRCVLLSQGHMIPAVSGNGGYGKGKGFVSADELRSQLLHLRFEKALIVKLVDIVDFNGSFLTRVRDLIGSNPIILVATKVDLLPKGTNMAAIGDWLLRATLSKKLNVISVHLTSAKATTGISGVAAVMQRQRQGRDVYVLGSANVGKSAFISALLQEMGQRDPVAAAAQRFRPIQSAMPGTTLGPIQIDAFSGGGSLYDTPGVHLHHRMAAAVCPDDLPLLAPRRRLAGRIFSSLDSSGKAEKLAGQTLFWGGITRIDVLEAPENASLTFYGPSSIPVVAIPTQQSEAYYANELGVSLFPPGGTHRAEIWPGLVNQNDVTFTLDVNESRVRPAGDLVISGLGWVTAGASRDEEQESNKHTFPDGTVRLKVWTPKAVEVFMRPSMPVGATANDWYEYMEVEDDSVEASRPSLFQ